MNFENENKEDLRLCDACGVRPSVEGHLCFMCRPNHAVNPTDFDFFATEKWLYIGLMIMGFFLIKYGFEGSAFLNNQVAKQQAAIEKFKRIEGKILISKMEDESQGTGKEFNTVFMYQFELSKHRFISGTRFSYQEDFLVDKYAALKMAKRVADFPVGKTVEIYYDPENPGDTLLTNKIDEELLSDGLFWFIRFIWCGALLILVSLWRLRKNFSCFYHWVKKSFSENLENP